MRRLLLLVFALLFAVTGCASTPTGRPPDVWSINNSRPLAPPDLRSIEGPSDKVSVQGLLVERDGEVYGLALLLVEHQDGSKVLVDPIGQTYTGLDDFREHNTLLTPGDKLSAPSDVMTAGSTGTIATTGHAEPSTSWWPWLLGGIAALLVVVIVTLLTLIRRRRMPERGPDQGLEQDSRQSPESG